MNEHATNSRIIIDASYIRGMSKDGAPFRAMCEQGGRIVLIDTLIYELCTTCDTNQWRASMNKLKAGVEAIEVWEHVSPMYRFELKKNRRYGDPLHDEKTRRIREMIANNPQYQPADMKKLIKNYVKEREDPFMLKCLQYLVGRQPFSEEIPKKITENPWDEGVVKSCYELVNNPKNIRLVLEWILQDINTADDTWVKLNPDDVDDTWVIWHLCKSICTVSCDYRHQSDKVVKRLANAKHDLDYLVSLAFADGIASCETKGEMSYYRRWMYGDAKPQLCSRDTDEIACFMNEAQQFKGKGNNEHRTF